LNDFKPHLKKIKDANIKWVRMDVKASVGSSEAVFRKAHEMGLKIIGVITTKNMFKYQDLAKKTFFPGSNWSLIWKEQVKEPVMVLGPYVDIWQIENELNHPWHNFLPSVNRKLALDIVKIGAETVKENDPNTKVATNLFYRKELLLPGLYYPRNKPFIKKLKDNLQDKIDILGMDIFRGSWHRGSPDIYPHDLKFFHDLWDGDIMIMETGYCTGKTHINSNQAEYVENVFRSLDHPFKNVPWFRGIMWYEYHSSHSKIPCENFFGLHYGDGVSEKPAWGEFVKNIERYKKYNKILGITYHY
jgi:hypothetical protein